MEKLETGDWRQETSDWKILGLFVLLGTILGCSTKVRVRLNGDIRVVGREEAVGYAVLLPELRPPPPLERLREGEVVMVRILYVREGEPFDVAYFREGEDVRCLVRGQGDPDQAEKWMELDRKIERKKGNYAAYQDWVDHLCERAATEPALVVDEVVHRRLPLFDEDAAVVLHHVLASRACDANLLRTVIRVIYTRRGGEAPVLILDPTSLLGDVLRNESCDRDVLVTMAERVGGGIGAPVGFDEPRVFEVLEQLPEDVQEGTRRIPFSVLRWRLDRPDLLIRIGRHPRADETVRRHVREGAAELPPGARERVLKSLEEK